MFPTNSTKKVDKKDEPGVLPSDSRQELLQQRQLSGPTSSFLQWCKKVVLQTLLSIRQLCYNRVSKYGGLRKSREKTENQGSALYSG